MTTERAPETTRPAARTWTDRYPGRWENELADLKAHGWRYTVRYEQGTPRLYLRRTLARNEVARLRVDFPDAYPWFPPDVYDPTNSLDLVRHRSPRDGKLCLIEAEDWHVDRTLADLLEHQLPAAVALGRGQMRLDLQQDGGRFSEVRIPEPSAMYLAFGHPVVTIPAVQIPDGVDDGALMVRIRVGAEGVMMAATIEGIFGDGVELRTPLSSHFLDTRFPVISAGVWMRDPEFNATHSAEQTWKRIKRRIRETTLESSTNETRLAPESLRWVGLLIPSETGYGLMGERWVFLLNFPERLDPDAPQNRYIDAQEIDWSGVNVRIPDLDLRDRTAVVVGVGAVGSRIAVDLARSGVSRLVVIDGDIVDCSGPGVRQRTPFIKAGTTKVEMLGSDIRAECPLIELLLLPCRLGVSSRFDHPSAGQLDEFAQIELNRADLVVDAAASPPLTRWLAARQRALGIPFLHASATAGGWGGVAAVLVGDDGCWACVEHHRADSNFPVPPADPDGMVVPAGCGDTTFTGSAADIATVAHHASRLALGILRQRAGQQDQASGRESPVRSRYDVAAQYGHDSGLPVPVSWTSTGISVHPLCPLHIESGESDATEGDDTCA